MAGMNWARASRFAKKLINQIDPKISIEDSPEVIASKHGESSEEAASRTLMYFGEVHWENNLKTFQKYSESPLEEALYCEMALMFLGWDRTGFLHVVIDPEDTQTVKNILGRYKTPPDEPNHVQDWLDDMSRETYMVPQAQIKGLGRVDLVVNKGPHFAVVEADGYEYHKDRQQFDRDRERDRFFQSKGWSTLRFTSETLFKPGCKAGLEFFDSVFQKWPERTMPDAKHVIEVCTGQLSLT